MLIFQYLQIANFSVKLVLNYLYLLLVHDLLLIHDVGLNCLLGLFYCRLQSPENRKEKLTMRSKKEETERNKRETGNGAQ